jgi:hypothetical protein
VPDVRVGDEPVLQPEAYESDLPPREPAFVAGQVARGGADPALQAGLKSCEVPTVGLEERAVRLGCREVEGMVSRHRRGSAAEAPTEIDRAGGGARRVFRIHAKATRDRFESLGVLPTTKVSMSNISMVQEPGTKLGRFAKAPVDLSDDRDGDVIVDTARAHVDLCPWLL